MVSKVQVDLLSPQFRNDLASVHERISGFAALQPDWDSYGAERPSTNAIQTAHQVIDDLVILYARRFGEKVLPFWASPLSSGGVQLEWRSPESHRERALELEVEVDANGRLAFLLQKGQGADAEYEEGEGASFEDVASLLDRVLTS
jgi:hypothetical protein